MEKKEEHKIIGKPPSPPQKFSLLSRGKERRLKKGIYILPSLFTVGNLFCGFYSIVLSMNGEFELAAIMIFSAALLDGLDGRIARLTRSTSDFGIEFDSLADIISFGIAPSFLVYLWGLAPLKRIGWLIAFLYVVSVAMRLARFNLQKAVADKRYFIGMPAPAAAVTIASCAFFFTARITERTPSILLASLILLLSILVISKMRYRSFKDIDLRSRKSYLYIFFFAIAFVAVAIEPKIVVFIMSLAYLVSGIFPMFLPYLKKSHVMHAEKEKKWSEEGEETVAER
jgi:CDP-diacylglycerol--serine O-phosphatidyltransferase